MSFVACVWLLTGLLFDVSFAILLSGFELKKPKMTLLRYGKEWPDMDKILYLSMDLEMIYNHDILSFL